VQDFFTIVESITSC